MTQTILDVSECTKCYARQTIGNLTPVSGVGPPDADIMILKDCPNIAAVEMNEPIDEIEKKILHKMLEAAYINIDDVYITTITKCPSKLKKDVVDVCKPYLWTEIQTVQPKVIMTMGAFATNLLFKTTGSFRENVGQMFSVDYTDAKIVPIYQPFWIMQNPQKFRHIQVMALLKARNLVNRNIGKIAEEYTSRLLQSAEIQCEFNEDISKLIEYDLLCKMGKKKFTVEVKFDVKSAQTGNICCEVWNTKKDEPSGIYASTADIFVYVLNDGPNMVAFAINRLKLLSYIETVKPKRVIDCGGDDNAKLFLYPDLQILNEFTQIDNLTAVKLKKTLSQILKNS
jgi:uracil-DNA glycosylase family 4